MKMQLTILSAALLLASPSAFGDAHTIFQNNCASCHGAGGAGLTKKARRAGGVKNYTTAEGQNWSDEEGVKAILEGVKDGDKIRMEAYAGKISEAEAKELVAYIRQFKK